VYTIYPGVVVEVVSFYFLLFQRAPHQFEILQKLEVVDKRNPILIRVATIMNVEEYRIRIHFDGWSDVFDDWLDDDCPDFHPPGWCAKTGHPLQPPISKCSGQSKILIIMPPAHIQAYLGSVSLIKLCSFTPGKLHGETPSEGLLVMMQLSPSALVNIEYRSVPFLIVS
jgi:hypothetical protein